MKLNKKKFYTGLFTGLAVLTCAVPVAISLSTSPSETKQSEKVPPASNGSECGTFDHCPVGGEEQGYGYTDINVISLSPINFQYGIVGIQGPQSQVEKFGGLHLQHDSGYGHGAALSLPHDELTPTTNTQWVTSVPMPTYDPTIGDGTEKYLAPGTAVKIYHYSVNYDGSMNGITDLAQGTVGGIVPGSVTMINDASSTGSVPVLRLSFQYQAPVMAWIGLSSDNGDNVIDPEWTDGAVHNIQAFDKTTGWIEIIPTDPIDFSNYSTGYMLIQNIALNSLHTYDFIFDIDGDGDYQQALGVGNGTKNPDVADAYATNVTFDDGSLMADVSFAATQPNDGTYITSDTAKFNFVWSANNPTEVAVTVYELDASGNIIWSNPITSDPVSVSGGTSTGVSGTTKTVSGLKQLTDYVAFLSYPGQNAPSTQAEYDSHTAGLQKDEYRFTTAGYIKSITPDTSANGSNGMTQYGGQWVVNTFAGELATAPANVYWSITEVDQLAADPAFNQIVAQGVYAVNGAWDGDGNLIDTMYAYDLALKENHTYKLWLSEDAGFSTALPTGTVGRSFEFTTDQTLTNINILIDSPGLYTQQGFSYQNFDITYEDNTGGYVNTPAIPYNDYYIWFAPMTNGGTESPNADNPGEPWKDWVSMGPLTPETVSSNNDGQAWTIEYYTETTEELRANTTYQMYYSSESDPNSASKYYIGTTNKLPAFKTEKGLESITWAAPSDSDRVEKSINYTWNSSEAGEIWYTWFEDSSATTDSTCGQTTWNPYDGTHNWTLAGTTVPDGDNQTGGSMTDAISDLPADKDICVAFSMYDDPWQGDTVLYRFSAQPGYIVDISIANSDIDITEAYINITTQNYDYELGANGEAGSTWDWRVYETSDPTRNPVDMGSIKPEKDFEGDGADDGTGAVANPNGKTYQIYVGGDDGGSSLKPNTTYTIEIIRGSDWTAKNDLESATFTTEYGIVPGTVAFTPDSEGQMATGHSHATVTFDYDSDEAVPLYYQVYSYENGIETPYKTQVTTAPHIVQGAAGGTDGDDYIGQTFNIPDLFENQDFVIYISSIASDVTMKDPQHRVEFETEIGFNISETYQAGWQNPDGVWDNTQDIKSELTYYWTSDEWANSARTIYYRNTSADGFNAATTTWTPISLNTPVEGSPTGGATGTFILNNLVEGGDNWIEFSMDQSAMANPNPDTVRRIKIDGDTKLNVRTKGYFADIQATQDATLETTDDTVGMTHANFTYTINSTMMETRDSYWWVTEDVNGVSQKDGVVVTDGDISTDPNVSRIGTIEATNLKPGTDYTFFISTQAERGQSVKTMSGTISTQFTTDKAVTNVSLDTSLGEEAAGYSYYKLTYTYASQDASSLFLKAENYDLSFNSSTYVQAEAVEAGATSDTNSDGVGANQQWDEKRTVLITTPWTPTTDIPSGSVWAYANIQAGMAQDLVISSSAGFEANASTKIAAPFTTDVPFSVAVTSAETGSDRALVDVTWTSNQAGTIYTSVNGSTSWVNESLGRDGTTDDISLDNDDELEMKFASSTSDAMRAPEEVMVEGLPEEMAGINVSFDVVDRNINPTANSSTTRTLQVNTVEGVIENKAVVTWVAPGDVGISLWWAATLEGSTSFTIIDQTNGNSTTMQGILNFEGMFNLNATTNNYVGYQEFRLSEALANVGSTLTVNNGTLVLGHNYTITFGSGATCSWTQTM